VVAGDGLLLNGYEFNYSQADAIEKQVTQEKREKKKSSITKTCPKFYASARNVLSE